MCPTTITKQDGWKYPQAIIDFYWGPQMAGKTWYIYFEGTHDGDSSAKLIYKLGTVTCEAGMGRNSLDAASWELKRPEPKKLQFSIPSVPENNAGNNDVKNDQKHEAWYDLTLTYTTYDGKTKEEKYKYDCGTARTTHDIDIPDDVNNFRSLDVKVVATDAYKAVENGDYFYKRTPTYDKKNYLPTVPVPSGLSTEYHQFDNKVDLTWTAFTRYGGTYNYYDDSEPYVYRIETDKNGTPLSGQSWSRRGTLSKIGSNTAMSYSDKDKQGLQPNRYYKYMVVNVPKAWKTTLSAQLSNPSDDLLKQLGHCESTVVSTAPQMDIYDLQQDLSVTDKVALQWQYSRIPVSSSDVTFEVWRAPYGTEQWTSIGNTKAKANPEAGTKPTFEDKNLENNTVRYHYKVSVTINDGVNKAESNVITGSLLTGSSIKTFAATKGTHEGTVRLQWDVKQVGTGNTHYDVYRRYVGGAESDWMRIYTTVGTSDSYTYEDNTVQPGYYYDYRVECYSGTKTDGSTELSVKSDIGFCQARGVVSGRVTFGSGSTVEDVRITLRPGGEDGDNAVRGYSQRVSDASTGIAWNASEDELAKVFGPDKDFTVQMFVRPDSALSEGAVIGEIPGEGRLVVGKQTGADYELQLQKVTGYVEPIKLPESNKTTNLSTLKGNYEAKHCETLTGTLSGNYKISIANGATVFLKDVTIKGAHEYSYNWAGINCPGDATLVLEGNNTVEGFSPDYPAIHIAKGKTLTIKGTGSLTANGSWYATGIGGGYNVSCGNIVIEGGTITATGQNYSPGIGSGQRSSCGNITITGGIITAKTSRTDLKSPGIGASYMNGTCGYITITSTVTSVTAIKGGSFEYSIGAEDGYYVMVGGNKSWGIEQSPYTYNGDGSWTTKFQQEKEGISGYFTYGSTTTTGLTLPAKAYSMQTVSRMGSNLQFQINNGEVKTQTATKQKHMAPFSVGGASRITDAQAFKGNITEVRVWNHVLTAKEQGNYADRVLSGRETGLALYWPMDEGQDRLIFDANYSNDMPNGRHATVGPNITSSQIVPAEEQLSRYGLTNGNGEYTIRGIPFVGSGSTYTFIPTKGIHTFSPVSRVEQVDSTKNTKDAIEAFSDTTAASQDAEDDAYIAKSNVKVYADEDVKGVFEQVFGDFSEGQFFGAIALVLGILFILFVLFPIIIISMVVYFINRNRRQRYKLAEMAIEKGQPIPDHIFKEEAAENITDYQGGIRQMFTGVGLAIFLGIIIGEMGVGIGALVFFIGLGKWYISRQANVNKPNRMNNNFNSQNNDKTTDAL